MTPSSPRRCRGDYECESPFTEGAGEQRGCHGPFEAPPDGAAVKGDERLARMDGSFDGGSSRRCGPDLRTLPQILGSLREVFVTLRVLSRVTRAGKRGTKKRGVGTAAKWLPASHGGVRSA